MTVRVVVCVGVLGKVWEPNTRPVTNAIMMIVPVFAVVDTIQSDRHLKNKNRRVRLYVQFLGGSSGAHTRLIVTNWTSPLDLIIVS